MFAEIDPDSSSDHDHVSQAVRALDSSGRGPKFPILSLMPAVPRATGRQLRLSKSESELERFGRPKSQRSEI